MIRAGGGGGGGQLSLYTFTVGAGGKFPNIDAALNFLGSLSTADVLTTVSGTTGTVTATVDADNVVGAGTNFLTVVQGGDFIKMSGDGVAPFIAGGIYFPVYGDIYDNTHLRIGCGFAGTTGAGKTYTIHRPIPYALILSPGFHHIASPHTMPDGIVLDIIGSGVENTVLSSGLGGADIAIGMNRCGALRISRLTVSRRNTASTMIGLSAAVLEEGFITFGLDTTRILDFAGVGGLFNIKAAQVNINDVYGTTYRGIGNFSSDGVSVNNLRYISYGGSADVSVFSNAGPGTFKGTKPMSFSSIHIDRKIANTTGAGGMMEVQALQPNREVFFNDLVLIDRDQGASANPNCLVLSGGGTGKFYIKSSIVDRFNAFGAGTGGIADGSAGDNVYLMGARNLSGLAVVTSGAATFTAVY